jgi:hypothetical protein
MHDDFIRGQPEFALLDGAGIEQVALGLPEFESGEGGLAKRMDQQEEACNEGV